MPHIVSTMTSDVKYTFWKKQEYKGGASPNVKEVIDGKDHVLVKGKHGIVRRTESDGVYMSNGVVTAVTDAELELLMKDEVFQTHLKNEAVKILKSKPQEPAKIAKDMGESPDRPLTAKDSQKGGRAQIPDNLRVNGGARLQ